MNLRSTLSIQRGEQPMLRTIVLPLLACALLCAGCSSGGAPPEDFTQNEDISAITPVSRSIFRIERELKQQKELFANSASELVVGGKNISPDDVQRLNAAMREYPKVLDTCIIQGADLKAPVLHNAAARAELDGAIASANQMFRMQRNHYRALAAGNLDAAEAFNNQCDRLNEETVEHLKDAYMVLGIPPEKIDTSNGEVKP